MQRTVQTRRSTALLCALFVATTVVAPAVGASHALAAPHVYCAAHRVLEEVDEAAPAVGRPQVPGRDAHLGAAGQSRHTPCAFASALAWVGTLADPANSGHTVVAALAFAAPSRPRCDAPSFRSSRSPPKDRHLSRFEQSIDQRHYEITFDGVLGENVLSRYHTVVDLDRARVWLGPRDADLGARTDERIHRWGETFASCATPGCASLDRQADGFTILRDPSVPLPRYQVVVQGLDDHGAPIAAPLLRVALDAPQVTIRPSPAYASAARFRVVDLSPFAPTCDGIGCSSEVMP